MRSNFEAETIPLGGAIDDKLPYRKVDGLLTFDPRDAISQLNCCKSKRIVGVPDYPSFGEKDSGQKDIKKIGIVFNPQGGGGHSLAIKDKFVRYLERKGLSYEIFQSTNLEDYYNKVISLKVDDFDVIMSCGGDGSIHHFFSALGQRLHGAQEKFKIGTIPGGTGNDFCKSAGIISSTKPTDSELEQYADRVSKGKFRTLDTMIVEYVNEEGKPQKRYSPSTFGMALSAKSVIAAEKYRFFGSKKYEVGAIHEILKNQPTNFSVKIDGKETFPRQDWKMLVISNTQFCGGGLRLAPYAQMDDGLLDIMLLQHTKKIGRKCLIKFLDKLKKGGTHIYEREAIYYRGKTIEIEFEGDQYIQIDGEIFKAKKNVSLKADSNLLQIIT